MKPKVINIKRDQKIGEIVYSCILPSGEGADIKISDRRDRRVNMEIVDQQRPGLRLKRFGVDRQEMAENMRSMLEHFDLVIEVFRRGPRVTPVDRHMFRLES